MDVVPHARFVITLFVAGLMIYIFNNAMGVIQEFITAEGIYYNLISALWHGVVFIVVFVEAIRYIRAVQERKGLL